MLFKTPDHSLTLKVARPCVDHWLKYQQVRFWQKEAGGLMFARSIGPKDGAVHVTDVAGPHANDKRKRHEVVLDHNNCINVIEEKFNSGLHFVGYWHTHPEPIPTLSPLDCKSFVKNIDLGDLEIQRMIAIVIGTSNSERAISAYMIDNLSVTKLEPYFENPET